MKSLSANTATVIDSPYVAPILLAELSFTSPASLTLPLSSRPFDPFNIFGSYCYDPLIESWKSIRTGEMDENDYSLEPGDFTLNILNGIPTGGFNSIGELLAYYDTAFATISLRLIFENARQGDDEIPVFTGRIDSLEDMNSDMISITVSDLQSSFMKTWPCEFVNADEYPGADPDEFGKMLTQAWGSCKRVPFRAVDAGGVTTLAEDIDDSQTGNITFSDVGVLPDSGVIQVELEQMTYSSKSEVNNTLNITARGYNSTDATEHDLGAKVGEIQAAYIYIIGHAIKAFNNVYIKDVLVPGSYYTTYTGQTGDEHPTYPGKAVIAFTEYPALYRKLIQSIVDTLAINDTQALTGTVSVNNTLSIDDTQTLNGTVSINNTLSIDDTQYLNDTHAIIDGISVLDNLTINDTKGVSDTIDVTTGSHDHQDSYTRSVKVYGDGYTDTEMDWDDEENAYDGDDSTYAHNPDWGGYDPLVITFTHADWGTVQSRRVKVTYAMDSSPNNFTIKIGSASTQTFSHTSGVKKTKYFTFTGDSWNLDVEFKYVSGVGAPDCAIYEVEVEVEYIEDATASAATGVAKTGAATSTGSVTRSNAVTKDGTVTETGDQTLEGSTDLDGDVTANDTLALGGSTDLDGDVTANDTLSLDGSTDLTGTVSLTGNSVADSEVGGQISADIEGWQDDDSGTITGTPDALIERPDHWFKDAIINRLGRSSSYIDADIYDASGALYESNGFALGICLTEPPEVKVLFNKVARQSKSLQYEEAGQHRLQYITDSPSSQKTVSSYRLDQNQLSINKTIRAKIVNDLVGIYDKHWSGYLDDVTACRNSVVSSHTVSQGRYGVIPDTVVLDYITSETHAQTVLDWIKNDAALQKMVITLIADMSFTDTEKGDILNFDCDEKTMLQALLGFVTSSDTLFRAIDKIYLSDFKQQLRLKEV